MSEQEGGRTIPAAAPSASQLPPEPGRGLAGNRPGINEPRLSARVAVATALIIVFFLLWREGILPSASTRALMTLCLLEILSLPLYAFLMRRWSRSLLQAYLRWTTDLLLITVCLHFLGGAQAFLFAFIYCLVILTTSMMGHRTDSFFLATLCSLFYLGLLLLEGLGVLPARPVWNLRLGPAERIFFPLLNVLFFYLTAYYASVFSQRLRQRGVTLEIVNAISRVASSSLDLKEILNRTLRFVLDSLGAEAGVIQFSKHVAEPRGVETETWNLPLALPENELHSLERIIGILKEETQPVIIRDLRNDPKSRHLGLRWFGSLLAAPILHKGVSIGVIVLLDRRWGFGRRRRFRREELELLVLISQQIAPAVVNARLYANLEDANRSIRQAQDEIVKREKFEALGEMMAGMGHQFRNPLLAIGAAAKRLSKTGKIPESMQFYVRIIQNETEKLEKILKDVPGFHIGRECKRKEVDVNVLIDRALSLVFEDAGKRGIRIAREFQEMKDPLPSADPDQLEVALYNIFSNAREAMGEEGTLRVKTRLDSGSGGRVLGIEVSDTGGGIPVEEVENIFNPFYTTKHWGAGLGLTMTHRIVENHGGSIQVLNRPGEGVTIRISIPHA